MLGKNILKESIKVFIVCRKEKLGGNAKFKERVKSFEYPLGLEEVITKIGP